MNQSGAGYNQIWYAMNSEQYINGSLAAQTLCDRGIFHYCMLNNVSFKSPNIWRIIDFFQREKPNFDAYNAKRWRKRIAEEIGSTDDIPDKYLASRGAEYDSDDSDDSDEEDITEEQINSAIAQILYLIVFISTKKDGYKVTVLACDTKDYVAGFLDVIDVNNDPNIRVRYYDIKNDTELDITQ
jgi:hypothetical protein